jgi:hypothetical protein
LPWETHNVKKLLLTIVFLLCAYLPAYAAELLQLQDLVYQGGFRVPQGQHGSSTFEWCKTCQMTFDPAGNGGAGSLFMVGHDHQQQIGEFSLATPVNTSNPASMNTATMLQNFVDVVGAISGTAKNTPPAGTVNVNGLLVEGSTLYVNFFFYYDADGSQQLNYFKSTRTLTTSGLLGPYQVGTPPFDTGSCCGSAAGFTSGSIIPVPSAYQSALGGTHMTGLCCVGIASRTSWGPAALTMNLANLGSTIPLPTTTLFFASQTHPITGWATTNNFYNGSTEPGGWVFPTGTKSMLFFGRHGTGPWCYGPGTTDPALAFTPSPTGEPWCYDLEGQAKGGHAYPYRYQIYAYNVDDAAAVKAGTKLPYDVRPYGTWVITFPTVASSTGIGGVAYDSAHQKIYVVQKYADGAHPIIHVFNVNAPSPPPTPRTLSVATTNPTACAITGVTSDLNGNGNGTTPFARSYNDASSVDLTAPATCGGNDFASWSGCTTVGGTGNRTCSVTMGADKTVTAAYTTPGITLRTLTVASTNPNGGITIAVSPADYNGLGNSETPFVHTYLNNTAVALTAPSAWTDGQTFDGFTGCDSVSGLTCNLTMSANKSVTVAYVTPTPPGASFPYNGTPVDTGTRANEGPPPSANWTTIVGTGHKIVSNKIVPNAASGTHMSYWNATQFDTDQEAYAEISTMSVNDHSGFGVFARFNPANLDRLECTARPIDSANDVMQLWERTNGATVQVGVDTSIGGEFTAGDQVGIRVVGATATCYLNGTAIMSGDTSANLVPGYIGLRHVSTSGATEQLINVGGGNLAAAPAAGTPCIGTVSGTLTLGSGVTLKLGVCQ